MVRQRRGYSSGTGQIESKWSDDSMGSGHEDNDGHSRRSVPANDCPWNVGSDSGRLRPPRKPSAPEVWLGKVYGLASAFNPPREDCLTDFRLHGPESQSQMDHESEFPGTVDGTLPVIRAHDRLENDAARLRHTTDKCRVQMLREMNKNENDIQIIKVPGEDESAGIHRSPSVSISIPPSATNVIPGKSIEMEKCFVEKDSRKKSRPSTDSYNLTIGR